ncbi:MAG: DNA cytosine methyltransferase [Dehalococcoidia bacterium]|nr:DNA cytosine methyltransferase [Dehalococcoidia bacterium]
MQEPTAVDLFAGAGGLSIGFREAGFSIRAANDFDADAAETFILNHPETAFIPGSIQAIEAEAFLYRAGLEQGELDVLIGGPPCRAFSVYNHQRGMHDERSGLFREYTRIVGGLMPRFVVMENVTGITSIDDGRAVEEIHGRLHGLGYTGEAHGIDVAFLLYCYEEATEPEEGAEPESHRLVFDRVVRTSQGSLMFSALTQAAPPKADFSQRILARLE